MKIDFRVEGASGEALEFRAIFFWSDGRTVERQSDSYGTLACFDDFPEPVSAYIIPRRGGFWSVAAGPPWTDTVFRCPLIKVSDTDWWRVLMNLPAGLARGRGARIGVIDSSFQSCGLQHHVKTVSLAVSPRFGEDDPLAHGAQVCSILVGRSSVDRVFEGVCLDAEVIHIPVGDSKSGPLPGSVAAAIWELAETHRVDLINLSLGDYPKQSRAIANAIDDAWDAGVLVVAAAGNEGGELQFPASHPRVAAIGAIGAEGVAPLGSIAYLTELGARTPARGGMYVCGFSPQGKRVLAAAPGNAVTIDVNGQGPFDLIGTSFSVPLAVSCLASALESDQAYRGLSGNLRSERARMMLQAICRPLGFDVSLQGKGVPQVK